MNPFPDPLHFDNAGFHNGRRRIVLTRNFPAITSFGIVTVKKGFVCDGGSIPKAAWSLIGDGYDECLEDFVLHDWFYSANNTEFSRAEADLIFRETMWNRDISRPKLAAIWLAVRMFGGSAWKKNRKGKA